MKEYNLDTNIFSEYLKESNDVVKTKILQESLNNKISISAITYYEIKRGLDEKTDKYSKFLKLIESIEIILYDDKSIFDTAAKIAQYFPKINNTHNYRDADILIAALCKNKDLYLVSNDEDFKDVPDLKSENWIK